MGRDLRPRPFANTSPMVYPACDDGPCKGGTRLCPFPEACQVSEQTMPRHLAWLLALVRRISGGR